MRRHIGVLASDGRDIIDQYPPATSSIIQSCIVKYK